LSATIFFPSVIVFMALPMSQLLAADALSPVDSTNWEHSALFSPTDLAYPYPLYSLPPSPPLSDHPSPVPTDKMLKYPDSVEPEPVCVPTHQLFDVPEVPRTPTPPSRSPSVAAQSPAAPVPTYTTTTANATTGSKRSASPPPPAAKKRAVGERISSKDFIPPDVSGLSKREARLVKNRAAAFLSRQRKREEFETMEM
jgi:hypothetical protein